jgi:hypothetical protein
VDGPLVKTVSASAFDVRAQPRHAAGLVPERALPVRGSSNAVQSGPHCACAASRTNLACQASKFARRRPASVKIRPGSRVATALPFVRFGGCGSTAPCLVPASPGRICRRETTYRTRYFNTVRRSCRAGRRSSRRPDGPSTPLAGQHNPRMMSLLSEGGRDSRCE